MRRISAIFIAVCMVLIAGSLGAVLYIGLKVDAGTSALAALAALIGMMLYDTLRGRVHDRGDIDDQIAGDRLRGRIGRERDIQGSCNDQGAAQKLPCFKAARPLISRDRGQPRSE